jgi:putative redox protein
VQSAVARWSSGLRFELDTLQGQRVEVTGDDGDGMQPTSMLLAALGACTGMDVISIAGKKRQAVGTYSIVVTGRQHEAYPKTFASIVVDHRFTGSDLDPAAIARCIFLSATRYCPVNAQLAMGDTTIEHRWTMLGPGDEALGSGMVITTGPNGAGLQLPRETDAVS